MITMGVLIKIFSEFIDASFDAEGHHRVAGLQLCHTIDERPNAIAHHAAQGYSGRQIEVANRVAFATSICLPL